MIAQIYTSSKSNNYLIRIFNVMIFRIRKTVHILCIQVVILTKNHTEIYMTTTRSFPKVTNDKGQEHRKVRRKENKHKRCQKYAELARQDLGISLAG